MNREEAIEVYNGLINQKIKEAFEFFAPELRESEAERIRKATIKLLNRTIALPAITEIDGIRVEQMIAYLEKQKVIAAIPDELVECYKNLCERGNRGVASLINAINGINEQKPVMIQWTGRNLKEVIDFTGKSPRFGEWFKSWEDFENYVHSHDDILKLFCEDGCHYEVPVGAWIVKTPDGYNIPSRFKFVQKPAEWSKEEKQKLNRIYEILGYAADDKGFLTSKRIIGDKEAIELQDFLKSLRPQPKQEWSKNDTVFLNEITDFFENKTVRLQHDIEMYAHWLKSLPERFQSLAKANEEQNRLSVQVWAARDKDGYVHVFENMPGIGVHPNTWTGLRLGHTLLFDPIFPDLKYEDGPVKVELKFRIIR